MKGYQHLFCLFGSFGWWVKDPGDAARAGSSERRTISVTPAATDTARVFTAVPYCLSQWERLKDDDWHYCASSLWQEENRESRESLFNHRVTRLTASLQRLHSPGCIHKEKCTFMKTVQWFFSRNLKRYKTWVKWLKYQHFVCSDLPAVHPPHH